MDTEDHQQNLYEVQKRRKGNAAYQDAQAAAAEVAHSSADEQVRWLWDSYTNAIGESFLEQEALTGIQFIWTACKQCVFLAHEMCTMYGLAETA